MENTIVFTAGSKKVQVNDKETTIKSAPVLSAEGVLMVELSAFEVLLDAECKYQEDIQSVFITESGLC